MILFLLGFGLTPGRIAARISANARVISFPGRLEALGDLRGASAEYLRLHDRPNAARCLVLAGDTSGALGLLEGDSSSRALLLRTRIYLTQWRLPEALSVIEALPTGPSRDSLAIMARLMLMDFEGARAEAHGDSGLLGVVDRAEETAPLLYSPGTAARLSCLPGAGHFYADEPGGGLLAGLVNAGVMALIVYSVYEKHYVDAALIYNFMFWRFYQGAAANASHVAQEKNRRLLGAWLGALARDTGFGPGGWP